MSLKEQTTVRKTPQAKNSKLFVCRQFNMVVSKTVKAAFIGGLHILS